MGHILKIHLDMFANSIDDLIKFAVLNISIFFSYGRNQCALSACHPHPQTGFKDADAKEFIVRFLVPRTPRRSRGNDVRVFSKYTDGTPTTTPLG